LTVPQYPWRVFAALAALGEVAVVLAGAALGGTVVAALRFLAIPAVPALHTRFVNEAVIPLWKRWVIVSDAAVLEEMLFRLFMLSAIAWAVHRLAGAPSSRPGPVAAWSANALAALAFAAAHVPQWLAMAPGNPAVVAVVMATNTAVGLVFGHLFLRKGIETAMAAHFGADVIVHVFGPGFLVS
jgi:hypothetical protein